MHHFYKLAIVFFLSLASEKIAAQQIKMALADHKPIRCYTTEVINEFRKQHPDAETDAQFEAWLNKKKPVFAESFL